MTQTPPTTATWTVLLFGAEARHAGRSSVEVSHAGAASAATLRALVERSEPSLAGRLDRCRIAVNHAFIQDGHLVQPGDEVALIGAVAGG